MSAFDIITDKDGTVDPFIGDELFNPNERLHESFKTDPKIPAEIRKLMNLPIPEDQDPRKPVVDAESSQQYKDDEEIRMAYF